jgi:3-dehydroquinate dehydratase
METCKVQLKNRQINVVGSFGNIKDLEKATRFSVLESCDLAEIRLDLLLAEGADSQSKPWRHLTPAPLLFTARRVDEGGGLALNAETRIALLFEVLEESSLIDIEVASISEISSSSHRLPLYSLP